MLDVEVTQQTFFSPNQISIEPTMFFTDRAQLGAMLRQAIDELKSEDVFAPVHVIAPSGNAAQSLARILARNGGVVNVRFARMHHLAESLLSSVDSCVDAASAARPVARPVLRPVARKWSPEAARELTRIVLRSAQSPLPSVATPALLASLTRVFADLRMRPQSELERIAESGKLAAEVIRLYGLFRERASKFSDPRFVIEQATECLDAIVEPVVAVIVEPPQAFEFAFLERLHQLGKLTVLAVMTGDEILDSALRTSLWGLGVSAGTPQPLSSVNHIAVLPDADLEVQYALSRMLQEAERGTKFSDMALLYPTASPYALIAHEQLRQAGMPYRGDSSRRLTNSALGRFVVGVLDVLHTDFARDSVLHLLGEVPMRNPLQDVQIDAAAWGHVARAARVSVGLELWRSRLLNYADDPVAKRRGWDLVALQLDEFIADFSARLQVENKTWREWARWMQELVQRYVGDAEQRADWPKQEAEAAVAVEQVLYRLASLDEFGGRVDSQAFLSAVLDALAARPRVSDPAGVFVGTIHEAVACQFSFVIIVGVAEGLLPATAGADALLHAVRVPGEELRPDRERRSFLLALQGTSNVILTLPRADTRAQRERRPSPWLLEQASLLKGTSAHFEDLLAPDAADWLTVVPSFQALSEMVSLPSSSMAARVGALGTGDISVSQENALARSMEVVQQRDSQDWTRFDGIAGAHSFLQLTKERPLSPTSLEHWAQCPFRYFLRNVLRVEEGTEEQDVTQTMARDRGELMHAAMEQFIREMPKRIDPQDPWKPTERERLHVIVDELLQQSRADGRSPEGLLLEVELQGLHQHVTAILEDDERTRAAMGVVPAAEDVELPFSDTTLLADTGAPVTFRGRIDRVDRSPDGKRIVAIDYKTGRSKYYPDFKADPVAAGEKLQLAIYGEALLAQNPDAEVEAQYWFVTDEESGYTRKTVTLNTEVRERLQSVLGVVAGGVQSGVFPLQPGSEDFGGYEHCRHCAYDAICPVDRGELWERKGESEVVSGFLSLRAEKS